MSELLAESPATTRAAPVSDAQRLRVLDALRGVALLGILLMNIPEFAMPNYFSESFKSDPTSINFWLNAAITVLNFGQKIAEGRPDDIRQDQAVIDAYKKLGT